MKELTTEEIMLDCAGTRMLPKNFSILDMLNNSKTFQVSLKTQQSFTKNNRLTINLNSAQMLSLVDDALRNEYGQDGIELATTLKGTPVRYNNFSRSCKVRYEFDANSIYFTYFPDWDQLRVEIVSLSW